MGSFFEEIIKGGLGSILGGGSSKSGSSGGLGDIVKDLQKKMGADTSDASTTTTTTTTSATTTTEVTTTTTTTEPEKEILRGDVNLDGIISIEDAQTALTAYAAAMAGLDSGLSEDQMKAVDVNLDGQLSIEDAQFILLYYVENSVSGNPTTWKQILT